MSVLPILAYPDPRLVQKAAPVAGQDVAALVEDLFDTMYAASGRGLAAPQIGVLARVFVMDAGWKTGAKTPLAVIDPEITPNEEEALGEEGCLSIPGLFLSVRRAARVQMTWTDPTGLAQSRGFDGIEARILQHENDHLNGTLTLDHLTPEAKTAALSRYRTPA